MKARARVRVSIRPDLPRALRSETRPYVLAMTEKGAQHAAGLANDDSGTYAREVEAIPTPNGARIVAGASHSTYLELGTRWMRAQRILLRTKNWLERGIDTTGRTTPSLTRGVPNGLTTVQARTRRRRRR